MDDVRMRHTVTETEYISVEESGVATPVLTPPVDFQDILEPPAIFGSAPDRPTRIRPKTELFWAAEKFACKSSSVSSAFPIFFSLDLIFIYLFS